MINGLDSTISDNFIPPNIPLKPVIDFDDKDIGIIALAIIAIVAILTLGHDGTSVAGTCVGGISGIVTGRFLRSRRE